jgi:hypothetical protein
VGDAQNDIKSRWSRLIRTAYAMAPQSAFVIHAGDLVSTGSRDDLWGEVVTNTQMFQSIEVNGDRMTVRSYSSEGEQLDMLQIDKKAGQRVTTAAAANGRR